MSKPIQHLQHASGEARATPVRWLVLGLLFCSTLLNYVDRQTVAVLKQELSAEFGLSNTGYSLLTAAFMVPYVIMYVLGGRMVDTWGSGRCMTLFVSVWSFATLAGGLVGSVIQLGISRFVLGAAEPGNMPAALRAVTLWFSSRERGFAVAVFSAGSAVGAIVAAPVIASVASAFGWRAVFLLLGAVGFVWVWVWVLLYREPLIRAETTAGRTSLRTLVENRGVRGVVLARLLSDPVWYVMLFWFPAFLRDQQGVSLALLGAIGWIPFLFADLGGIGASAWADRLVGCGGDPVASRLRILRLAALLGPLSAALAFPIGLPATVMVFSAVGAVCLSWFFGTAALLSEMLPPHQVAGALGVVGAAGALGGMLCNLAIGPMVDVFGYGVTFSLLAGLHPIAALVLSRHCGNRAALKI